MSYVYVVENSTTCRNSGFPVQGQVWGTLSSKFGRAACHVPCGTHACAPCNAILFSRKKKQAAGPNFLGQMLGVFCSCRTYMSLKTARLAVTLGSLCRDRFGVHYHPSLDALRAVCRVARMHVPCVMRSFLLAKKKNRPPVQIASVKFWVFFAHVWYSFRSS